MIPSGDRHPFGSGAGRCERGGIQSVRRVSDRHRHPWRPARLCPMPRNHSGIDRAVARRDQRPSRWPVTPMLSMVCQHSLRIAHRRACFRMDLQLPLRARERASVTVQSTITDLNACTG